MNDVENTSRASFCGMRRSPDLPRPEEQEWTTEQREELRQKINAAAWERDRAWRVTTKEYALRHGYPPPVQSFQSIEDQRDDLPSLSWLVRIVAGGVIALVVLFLVLVSGI